MLPSKIISGGIDGAESAALDVAISLGIPYGGWMPGEKDIQDNISGKKYELKKTKPGASPNHIEKNVIEANGTLILSHGRMNDQFIWMQGFSKKHNKPCLHIDLSEMTLFEASLQISQWVLENYIEILNVTGSTFEFDNKIYADTKNVLESAVFLGQTAACQTSDIAAPKIKEKKPQTVGEAVELLISGLTLKDRVLIANMTAAELEALDKTLGRYIRDTFGARTGNDALVASCCFESGNMQLHEDGVATVIINKLWEELRRTHKLKIVK